MSGRTIIDMNHIYKRFFIGQPNELEVLHGLDLQVNEGEFVSIVGASGSGKSTLMNIIGALDRPTSGSIEVNGKDIARMGGGELTAYRCKEIGFIVVPRLTFAWAVHDVDDIG